MLTLLSQADRSLGRLDGMTTMIPDPDFFLAMYVRKEAVLSSQIEGTQASLLNLLEYEGQAAVRGVPADVTEVVRYIEAMNYGLERIKKFPLSLRLLREIHARLLSKGRGADLAPGEFRRSQNWIGPAGCRLDEAVFVPPPVPEMIAAMGDVEKFIHGHDRLPALVKCGLIHCQFETIHPFLDGNGRLGRLLITFYLCQQGILQRPVLYLSYYFRQHQQEYYDRLMAVRTEGNWEGWLRFFMQGVAEIAREATDVAHRLMEMREEHRRSLAKVTPRITNALRLLDDLYRQPVVSVGTVVDRLGLSYAGANRLVALLVDQGFLKEITSHQRNRVFAYASYLQLFTDEPVEKEIAASLLRSTS
jgi:Fic family protein